MNVFWSIPMLRCHTYSHLATLAHRTDVPLHSPVQTQTVFSTTGSPHIKFSLGRVGRWCKPDLLVERERTSVSLRKENLQSLPSSKHVEHFCTTWVDDSKGSWAPSACTQKAAHSAQQMFVSPSFGLSLSVRATWVVGIALALGPFTLPINPEHTFHYLCHDHYQYQVPVAQPPATAQTL